MDLSRHKNDEAPKVAPNEASNLSVTSKELTMKSIATQIDTINVPFHGASLYIVSHNGEPYTPMKPIVEGMGITWQGQLEKIKSRFSKGVTEIVIPSAGGAQSMTCLALRKLNGWLQTVNPNKVKPEIRETVIQYQEECDDVLYDYWTKGQATNPRKSKKSLPGKMTTEQQEAVKQLVLTRGKTLPKEKQAKAMITMWSALKTHFGVSYKNIDENQFTEALSLAARIPLEGEFIGKEESSVAEETYTMTLSRSELCSLCWVWNAAEHMREVLVTTHPALEILRSSLASTFDTMGYEYQRTLNDGKEILLRETHNIKAHPYAVQDAAWRSVLPRLRNRAI